VPHISLVFREMWDTTDVDRYVHRVNRESEGESSGIPHLAKNERDMGHPSSVREPEVEAAWLSSSQTEAICLFSAESFSLRSTRSAINATSSATLATAALPSER
jgi:hypothetical protein